MKKSYLLMISAFILAVMLPFALSAIAAVNLNSPLDGFWTNNTTPDFNFSAVSDSNLTFSCSLYVDDAFQANGSVNNNTNTILTSTLTQGAHNWYVNCTDAGGTTQSETRTINIDTAQPVVTLKAPSNNTVTTNHRIDFEFKATDNLDSQMSCKLYIDGDYEDTETAKNNTNEEFNSIDVESGNHTWYVECDDQAGNTGQSETRTLEIQSYCEDGECGNLELTVKEPDSGDDFYPGENITVKVKVKNKDNDDLDVVIEAELYDVDEDETVDDDEETLTVEEDDTSDTITLILDIPYGIDESHDYVVRVKAYEDDDEDSHCDEDSVSIDLKRQSHDISIEKFEIDQSIVACGGVSALNVKIANTGKNDEEVKIEISSSIFNWTKTQFDLDSENSYSVTVPVVVPANAVEGTYTISLKVYYHYYSSAYHESALVSETILVQGNCPPAPSPDASISTSQTSDAFIGQTFRVKIAVKNTGNVKTNYTISASGYEDWASLNSIEPSTLSLNSGHTGYVYISLNPDSNATGTHSFTATISFDSTTKEQTVNVEVRKQTTAAAFFDKLDFEWNRNWQWFALIILFAVVIIILIILLALQGRKHRQYSTPAEIRLRTISAEKLGQTKGKNRKK